MGIVTDIINTSAYGLDLLKSGVGPVVGTNAFGRISGFSRERERDEALNQKFPKPKYGSLLAKPLRGTGKEEFLTFHITKEATHSFDAQITQFAIDSEAAVTDHRVIKNSTFTVEVIFSDATYTLLASAGSIPKDTARAQSSIYQALKRIRDGEYIITLTTALDTFADVALSRFLVTKNVENGRSLYVSMTFEQTRRVKLTAQGKTTGTTTIIIKPDADTSGAAAGNTNTGTGAPVLTPFQQAIMDQYHILVPVS